VHLPPWQQYAAPGSGRLIGQQVWQSSCIPPRLVANIFCSIYLPASNFAFKTVLVFTTMYHEDPKRFKIDRLVGMNEL
jgi:hypothetical protein